MKLICVHVGKTGGVHVHRVLMTSGVNHVWMGHFTPLSEAAESHPAGQLLIGIRDPVQHALSAVNARRRRRHHWTEKEKSFFARFPSTQAWCDALGTGAADEAFSYLGHLPFGLAHYFQGDFRRHLHRTWIYDTATLSRCVEVMFDRLGVAVPKDNDRYHNASPERYDVSKQARRKLRERLSKDYRLYEELSALTLCKKDM